MNNNIFKFVIITILVGVFSLIDKYWKLNQIERRDFKRYKLKIARGNVRISRVCHTTRAIVTKFWIYAAFRSCCNYCHLRWQNMTFLSDLFTPSGRELCVSMATLSTAKRIKSLQNRVPRSVTIVEVFCFFLRIT